MELSSGAVGELRGAVRMLLPLGFFGCRHKAEQLEPRVWRLRLLVLE